MDPEQPSEAKHWGTLGTILWALAVALAWFALQAGVAIGFTLRVPQAGQLNGTAVAIGALVSNVGCVLLLLAVIKLKRGSRIGEYLALRTAPVKPLLMWLGILTAFIALSDSLTFILGRPLVPESMTNIFASTRPVWLIWLEVVVVAPIAEELFFRGFLFKGFSSGPLRPTGAIIATAILWAMVHGQYDLYGICTIFLQGLLQGAARMTTKSLTVPVLMHVEANLVASLETAFLGAAR